MFLLVFIACIVGIVLFSVYDAKLEKPAKVEARGYQTEHEMKQVMYRERKRENKRIQRERLKQKEIERKIEEAKKAKQQMAYLGMKKTSDVYSHK